MSQDRASQSSSVTSPVNIVIGGAGVGLLLAAASVAYFRSQKTSQGPLAGALDSAKSKASIPGIPINFKGKWALNSAIRMIEHDTSRKVLLTVLKSIAKRSK